MKLHFLLRRKQELEEIKNIPEKERMAYIETRVDAAIKYAKTLSNEGIEVGDFSQLNTWKSLVQQFIKKS